MKTLQQKRQQFTKQQRSKQRNKIFAQNRQKLFNFYQDQSLVSMIFLIIDNDQQQISAESFEDFLEIISQEILSSEVEEKKINQEIAHAVLDRYGSMLSDFKNKLKQTQKKQRICLIFQNKKVFDLLRFLNRLQIIEQRYLKIFDSLLESAQIRLKQQIKNTIYMFQNNKNNKIQNDQSTLMDELIMILEFRFKLYKQFTYLYFLATQLQCTNSQQKGLNFNIRGQQKEIIISLTQKWLVDNLLIDFLIQSPELVNVAMKKSYAHQQKMRQILTQYQRLYLGFVIQHSSILHKLIIGDCTKKASNKSNIENKKIIQLLFLLFSSLNEKKLYSNEIDISQCNNSIGDQIILFMQLSSKIIKSAQSFLLTNNNQSLFVVGQNKNIYQLIIKCLVDSFVNSNGHNQVFIEFINEIESKQTQAIIQSFIHLNKVNKNQNNTQLQTQQPLIIKLLRSIQDLEYHDLVFFIQLLSIIISYNQTPIDMLFKCPEFQTYYDQKLNFQIILQKKLLRHMSGEIRRRAVWMLSNIAGSEEFYFYSLRFIKGFYIENVLEDNQRSQSLGQMTKQNALITESILQTIMNYLSNLTSFNEIQQLLSFDRNQNKQGSFEQYHQSQQYEDCLYEKNKSNQSLFIWIVRSLASIVQNLANNTVIMKQTQKFIQVLIYSLYNILALEQQHKQQQEQKNCHVILSIMQTYSIPKNLQTIYQNTQTTNQYSQFFSMMETLLDLINKAKGDQN